MFPLAVRPIAGEDGTWPKGELFGVKPATMPLRASHRKYMRVAVHILAVLTIAALLAPSVRWASLGAGAETCACPPSACTCPGHHHSSGKTAICCMGRGGRCGIGTQDSYLSSVLSTLVYMPTEHPWWNPTSPWSCGSDPLAASPLPSHARIPDQPPRTTL
jgi:hypothetical protein